MTDGSFESSHNNSYLIEEVEQNHFSIPIAKYLYSQLVLLLSLLSGSFLLPYLYKNEEQLSTDTFSAMIYLHVTIWVFITITTWHIKAEHKTSRILGYHKFYDATRYLHRVVFYATSAGNVMYLIVSSVTHNYCDGAVTPCGKSSSLTPINYLQIFVVFEVALASPLLTKHIVEIFRFNQRRSPPDVFGSDFSANSLANANADIVVGIRGSGHLERLLERQADQLMTLQRKNDFLNQRIFELVTAAAEERKPEETEANE